MTGLIFPDDTEHPVKTVEAAPGIRVTVTGPVVHQCPFRDETDEGVITIAWNTGAGTTLELHGLREFLDLLDEWVVSHETYVDGVRDELSALLGLPVAVSAQFETAGLEVSCSTSPTLSAVAP
jgi:hypothetical protein